MITDQPKDTTVNVNQPAKFRVTAAGTQTAELPMEEEWHQYRWGDQILLHHAGVDDRR